MFPRLSRAALAAACIAPLLTACGLDHYKDASVRFLNATTEYTALSLYDQSGSSGSNNVLVGGVASGTVSGYNGLTEGSYTFSVNSSSGSSTTGQTSQTVSKNVNYLVVGYVAGGKLQTQFITENESAPGSGNAKLRIFNAASQDVGGVDVYITATACNALGSADTPVGSAVTGLQTSFTQIIASAAGSPWNVCVTAPGNRGELLLSLPQVTFTDQQVTTLVLTHTVGGVLLNGALIDQQGSLKTYQNTLARVRLVADASGAAAVGVAFNGSTLSSGASPVIGNYQSVTAGAFASTIQIGGSTISSPTLNLSAGSDYTLLVAGTAAAPTVQLLADDNTPSTNSSLPVKVRLVNGLNGLGVPPSLTVGGSQVASSIAFGTASTYGNVAAGAGTVSLQAAAGTALLYTATQQTLASGAVYTVFLLGDYTGTQSSQNYGTLLTDRQPATSTSGS